MQTLIERLRPYLDADLALVLAGLEPCPCLCRATYRASHAGAIHVDENLVIQRAIEADMARTFRSGQKYKCQQWWPRSDTFDMHRQWAEKLLVGVDKQLESML